MRAKLHKIWNALLLFLHAAGSFSTSPSITCKITSDTSSKREPCLRWSLSEKEVFHRITLQSNQIDSEATNNSKLHCYIAIKCGAATKGGTTSKEGIIAEEEACTEEVARMSTGESCNRNSKRCSDHRLRYRKSRSDAEASVNSIRRKG